MSESKDGGPAFPTGEYEKGTDRLISGMSLRDYFAAQAMVGTLAGRSSVVWSAEAVARRSYELADAMLKERGK